MRESTDLAAIPAPVKMDLEMNRYLLAASPPDFFLFKAAEQLESYMIKKGVIPARHPPSNRRPSPVEEEEEEEEEELDSDMINFDCGSGGDDDNDVTMQKDMVDEGRADCSSLSECFTSMDLNLHVGSPRTADLLDIPSPDNSPRSTGTVNITVSGTHVDIDNTGNTSRRRRTLKKKVSFADEMGDRLATYCFIPRCGASEYTYEDPFYLLSSFANTRPQYTSSPYTSSLYAPTSFLPTSVPGASPTCVETVHTICSLGFDQPSSNFSSFLTRLDGNSVCLENAKVEDSNVFCSVRVKNVAFEKSVSARVTYDNWRTSVDVKARYVPSGLSVPMYDTFSFQIDSPPAATLQTRGPRNAEFAICYRCGDGREHWDNNNGANYKIMWMPRQRYSRPA